MRDHQCILLKLHPPMAYFFFFFLQWEGKNFFLEAAALKIILFAVVGFRSFLSRYSGFSAFAGKTIPIEHLSVAFSKAVSRAIQNDLLL